MTKKLILPIVFIVLMAVGYAAISTSFFLDGSLGIEQGLFDVQFTSVIAGENDLTKDSVSEDGKKFTYVVTDQSKVTYEVTNLSKDYDVEVNVICSITPETIEFQNNFNNKDILIARTSRIGNVTLTLPETSSEIITLVCTLDVVGLERTEKAGDEITKEVVPYIEEKLNGADPVLKNGLIPVTIADNGTVTYASTNSKWYDYENKEWANAVILSEGVTHEVGDTIPESDIESYFVWIPKYKYQIFDMGNYSGSSTQESKAQEIQIEFTLEETEDTDTSCISPKIAGESGTCAVGKWMTHPAFQNFDVTGLWVGKFETGYKGATSKTDAQKNKINDINDNKIIIKPNVYSWRSNTVRNFFKSFYNYKRELDSHMMKNTEWGAVAYLSHSKYGINTEVRINNNSNYLTGYAGNTANASGSATNNQAYNTETGYLASTTGNITGVYDMSGGAWEYMSASRGTGGSGLTSEELTEYAKYIDTYPASGTSTTYTNRILGDAVGEMGPFSSYQNSWYADRSYFVVSDGPWITRGGDYGDGVYAGQFYFHRSTGEAYSGNGARLVLAVK